MIIVKLLDSSAESFDYVQGTLVELQIRRTPNHT